MTGEGCAIGGYDDPPCPQPVAMRIDYFSDGFSDHPTQTAFYCAEHGRTMDAPHDCGDPDCMSVKYPPKVTWLPGRDGEATMGEALIKFLWKRLAEDKAAVQGQAGRGEAEQARAVAELEAKGRIVTYFEGLTLDGAPDDVAAYRLAAVRWIVIQLAVPYGWQSPDIGTAWLASVPVESCSDTGPHGAHPWWPDREHRPWDGRHCYGVGEAGAGEERNRDAGR